MSSETWGKIWDPYIDTAIGAWNQGDKKRADKIVSLLVQVLKQGRLYSSVDDNLINGLYTVADHFCSNRAYARAEWIYLEILESQEDILGPDDPHALETLIKLRDLVMAWAANPEAPSTRNISPHAKFA